MKIKNILLILVIALSSCGKKYLGLKLATIKKPLTGTYIPIVVTVNTDQPGRTLPDLFVGLSYESELLGSNPAFLDKRNTVLVNLFKNLGNGTLRIGGATSDKVKWLGNRDTSRGNKNSLTTADVDRLAEFSQTTGWPVIFGLNLGTYDIVGMTDEAKYVYRRLRKNLYAFQSGNEPDVLTMSRHAQRYNYGTYQQDWEAYLAAIRLELPGAKFAGPDVTPFNNNWITSFCKSEHQNIEFIDGHYYVNGPATVKSINCNTILAQNPQLIQYISALNNISTQYHLPYRITECNSIFGGGKKGVSDVFAASLWALDFMWVVAENNGSGINFHGGDLVYSPVAFEKGLFVAKPVYYAMLAFTYAAPGSKLLHVALNRQHFNISAHACITKDRHCSITLINKEIKTGFAFSIQLQNNVSMITVARLTAPGIAARDSISFAGNVVAPDGTFKPRNTEHYRVNAKSFNVYVPAASAAVVTVE